LGCLGLPWAGHGPALGWARGRKQGQGVTLATPRFTHVTLATPKVTHVTLATPEVTHVTLATPKVTHVTLATRLQHQRLHMSHCLGFWVL
jgi:NADPH-dependent ferric siderophore reductase